MLQGKLATPLGIVHTKDLRLTLHRIQTFHGNDHGYERYGETQKVRPKVTDTMKLSGCLKCHKFPSSTNRFHTYISPKSLSSLNEAMSMLPFFAFPRVKQWGENKRIVFHTLWVFLGTMKLMFSPAAIQQHSRQHPKCSIYLGKKHSQAQTQQPPCFGQCRIFLC